MRTMYPNKSLLTPSPLVLATTTLLSVSLDWPILDMLYKCHHVIRVIYDWLLYSAEGGGGCLLHGVAGILVLPGKSTDKAAWWASVRGSQESDMT